MVKRKRALARIKRNFNAAAFGGAWGFNAVQALAAREAMVQTYAECYGLVWAAAWEEVSS